MNHYIGNELVTGFSLTGYEVKTFNEPTQRVVNSAAAELNQYLPKLLEFAIQDRAIYQYYTDFDEMVRKNAGTGAILDVYYSAGYKLGLGVKKVATQDLPEMPETNHEMIIRTITSAEFMVWKIKSNIENLVADCNSVWENEIWQTPVTLKRKFVFDFVKFETDDGNNYSISFYIGI